MGWDWRWSGLRLLRSMLWPCPIARRRCLIGFSGVSWPASMFVVHGAVPIGALFGGLVAAWAGIGYTYMASALSAAAVAPYLWFTLKDAVLDPRRVQPGTSDS